MKTALKELRYFLYDKGYVVLLGLYEKLESLSFVADRNSYDRNEYEKLEVDYLTEEAEYDFKVLYYRNEGLINKIKEVTHVVDLIKAIREPHSIGISSKSESTYLTFNIFDLDTVLDFIYTHRYISRYYSIDNLIEEYDYSDRRYFTIRISTHDTGSYMDMRTGGITYYDEPDVSLVYTY